MGEDGMRELGHVEHALGVDRVGPVERYAVLALGIERLQAVHVVGHGGALGGLLLEVEVPARPGAAAAREQRGVGVEHDVVGLVRMTPCGVTAVSSARVPRSHPRRGNQ